MARHLKRGRDAKEVAANDAKVRATVEGILDRRRDARRCGSSRAVGKIRQMVARNLSSVCGRH